MTVERIARTVVEMVGNRAEAQVIVDAGHHGLTRFANSFIHQNVADIGPSIRLKLAADNRVASATSTRTDDASLRRLVASTIEAAALRPVDEDWPGLAPVAESVLESNYDHATVEADPAARATQVRAFVEAGGGLLAAGYCDTEGGDLAFANSAGQLLTGRRSRATLDGIHRSQDAAGSGHVTSFRLADVAGATIGRRAARLARDGVDPIDVEPGSYEVVLGPECVASLMYFLAFYGWNAKQHAEGQSFVEIGSQQFDSSITVDDDPSDPLAVGLSFDADGVPKRPHRLVERGVSRMLVHDRRTARIAGASSTGHAVPGGDAWGAFPVNLHVRGGGRSPEDLVSEVDRGLLVQTFNYCRILDPRTQVITGLTRNGTFLIENGEITRPVTNLRFTSSIIEALAPGRVLGVGSDARLADSEVGAGLVSSPTLRLAGWSFTGGAHG